VLKILSGEIKQEKGKTVTVLKRLKTNFVPRWYDYKEWGQK
jgi:hypothetical protein